MSDPLLTFRIPVTLEASELRRLLRGLDEAEKQSSSPLRSKLLTAIRRADPNRSGVSRYGGERP
jgi:hypothetical protein